MNKVFKAITLSLIPLMISCAQKTDTENTTTKKNSITSSIDSNTVKTKRNPVVFIEKQLPKKEVKYFVSKCDSIEIKNIKEIRIDSTHLEVDSVYSFNETIQVYCGFDTAFQVVAEVPFNTGFKLIHKITKKISYTHYQSRKTITTKNGDSLILGNPVKYSRQEVWFKVKNNAVSGYVADIDIADIDSIPNVLVNGFTHNEYNVKIKSFTNLNPNYIIDTMTLFKSHGYRIEEIKTIIQPVYRTLKYYTYRESCPGSETIEIIHLDSTLQFESLVYSNSSGEMDEYDKKGVYFPTKDSLGDIVFADLENLNNPYPNEYYKVFQYPKDITVPKESLIIIQSSSAGEKEIMKKDESGSSIWTSSFKETIEPPKYYQWTGKKLEEVFLKN